MWVELVLDKRLIHFKYSDSFLATPYNLSPIRLPLGKDIYTGHPNLFDGLPGLFYDSLPDSWGKLLLDKTLSRKSVNPKSLNSLDRLMYVGRNGPGALVYTPATQESEETSFDIHLDILAEESNAIIQGAETEAVEKLYALGGSSGGARPKVTVLYHPKQQSIIFGSKSAPGYEHWLIKFPSAFDEPDIAHIEYAYYLMAIEAGIEMMPSKLIKGASGKSYFGTKRFDRDAHQRFHVHSAAGLLHDDFRYSQMDYGHLMDAGFELTRHVKTHESIMRLAAFNLYTHNRDDHSKNVAFMMDQTGKWKFAPAYDLTFSTSSQGHHSTTFAGESLNPTSAHLHELARTFGVSNVKSIVESIKSVTKNWNHFANEAGVSKASKHKIEQSLNALLVV